MRLRVLEAMVVLAAARLTLAVGGFPRMLTREQSTTPRDDDATRARNYAKAVVRASQRLPIRTTCLDRALALWWLLRMHGIGGALRLGVRGGERLEAHAWVEHAGAPLYDDEASDYIPLVKP